MEEVLSEVEWGKEAVIKLIDLYREYYVLWDQTCAEFKDRNEKNKAWTEISLAMKLSKAEVQAKMKKLIGQFQRECKKLKSGSGADSVKSKWFAFDSLQFIKDKTTPRQTREAGLCGQHNRNEVSKTIYIICNLTRCSNNSIFAITKGLSQAHCSMLQIQLQYNNCLFLSFH